MLYFDRSIPSKIFLFILFVYCIVPAEGEGAGGATLNLYIRLLAAILIALFAILYKPRIRSSDISLLLMILAIVLMAVTVSFSLRFFITLSAILMAFIFARAVDNSTRFRAYANSATLILIGLSVVMLIVQIVAWYGFGKLLIIHDVIFPYSTGRTEEHIGFARLGGMYIEPGTFSHWSYGLLLLHILIVRQVKSSYMSVVGIAMACSLSVWGVLIGIFLTVVSLAQDLKNKSNFLKKLTFFVAILIIAVLGYGFYELYYADYIQRKLELESGSGESKVDAFEIFLSNWQNMLIVGYGFDPELCKYCLSFQDAGVFIGASRIFGIMAAICLFVGLFYYVYRLGGVILLLIFLPLLSCKFFYWDFILWMIFLLALTRLSASFRTDVSFS